jgi:predicted Fe-Mo cluster-binding NifX family protein
VLSTLVIWISVLLNYFGIRFALWGISIDQIAAGFVLVFVAHTGWELLSNGMRVLLDASIDHETLNAVQALIEDHPAVSDVRSLTGRNAGRFRFLQAEVGLRTNDLQKAHQISEELENEIRRRIPHVERVNIHYEPAPRDFLRAAAPLSDTAGRLSSHFGESPYFAVLKIKPADHRLVNREIIENPYTETERGKGIRVAEWLVKKKIDELIIREDIRHKGPGYVLSNAGVRVHAVASGTLEEALDSVWS